MVCSTEKALRHISYYPRLNLRILFTSRHSPGPHTMLYTHFTGFENFLYATDLKMATSSPNIDFELPFQLLTWHCCLEISQASQTSHVPNQTPFSPPQSVPIPVILLGKWYLYFTQLISQNFLENGPSPFGQLVDRIQTS